MFKIFFNNPESFLITEQKIVANMLLQKMSNYQTIDNLWPNVHGHAQIPTSNK